MGDPGYNKRFPLQPPPGAVPQTPQILRVPPVAPPALSPAPVKREKPRQVEGPGVGKGGKRVDNPPARRGVLVEMELDPVSVMNPKKKIKKKALPRKGGE